MARHVFIVAEIGCNHNGDPVLAERMVREAAACGVDAVKFQTFSAEALISRFAPKAEYQKETTGAAGSQLEMTKKLELSRDDYLKLRDLALSLGLGAFSAAFDLGSLEFLASIGQKVWKVPSGEITNLPYLEKLSQVAADAERVIVSTGMATLPEIRDCLGILLTGGLDPHKVTVLHCNTEYPTPDEDANVGAMLNLRDAFPDVQVGLSDHTVGAIAAIGATALGASMVEKHFTLNKSLPGPDHRASATPAELRELVQGVRRMEVLLGDGREGVTPSERKNKAIARKSIVAAREIAAGEILSEENVTCKRPGTGISPMLWHQVLGQVAPRDFGPDELIELPGVPMQEEA